MLKIFVQFQVCLHHDSVWMLLWSISWPDHTDLGFAASPIYQSFCHFSSQTVDTFWQSSPRSPSCFLVQFRILVLSGQSHSINNDPNIQMKPKSISFEATHNYPVLTAADIIQTWFILSFHVKLCLSLFKFLHVEPHFLLFLRHIPH